MPGGDLLTIDVNNVPVFDHMESRRVWLTPGMPELINFSMLIFLVQIALLVI